MVSGTLDVSWQEQFLEVVLSESVVQWHGIGGISMGYSADTSVYCYTCTREWYRLPKIIFYGELQQGVRFCGGQKKSFKDCLKKWDIQPNHLEALAADTDRSVCSCNDLIQQLEAVGFKAWKKKHRKSRTTPNNSYFPCDICGRGCASRIRRKSGSSILFIAANSSNGIRSNPLLRPNWL